MISKEKVVEMVSILTDEIIANEVYFCELDAHAGDGDFGMSLAKGFRELKSGWDTLDRETIGSFLKSCAMVIAEFCGGASGPIWGSGFIGAARYSKDKEHLNYAEFAEMLSAAAENIMKRGGAKVGDKTLLDALVPAAEALKANAQYTPDLNTFLKEGACAAVKGAEETKFITATKGRASYLGERSLNFPDAGAYAIGILFTKIAEKI